MDLQYLIERGSYYLYDMGTKPSVLTGRREVRAMSDTIALAFDLENGILHKHGAADSVEAWAAQARKKLTDGGYPEMAADIVVVSGPLPVDEVNKCLSTSGYASELWRKLQDGSLGIENDKAPSAARPRWPG